MGLIWELKFDFLLFKIICGGTCVNTYISEVFMTTKSYFGKTFTWGLSEIMDQVQQFSIGFILGPKNTYISNFIDIVST